MASSVDGKITRQKFFRVQNRVERSVTETNLLICQVPSVKFEKIAEVYVLKCEHFVVRYDKP